MPARGGSLRSRFTALSRAALVALSLPSCTPLAPPSPLAVRRPFEPWDARSASVRARAHADLEADTGALDTFVAAYQAHLRRPHRPGEGCPFTPSCSHFAREALHRYGPWLGSVLVYDRLIIREHAPAPAGYLALPTEDGDKLFDPVP